MGYGVSVRYAIPADAPYILSILEEAAAHQRRIGAPAWDLAATGLVYIDPLIAAGECVVAVAGNEIMASMALQWCDQIFWPDRDDDAAGYLHRIAVRRSFAGGRATVPLTGFAAQEAQQRGRKFLRLDCAPLPKLLAVYERLGFAQVDTRIITAMGPDFAVARFERAL